MPLNLSLSLILGSGGGVGENQFLSQLFSAPKIGYSLRLIRSNYTGNCLKVRRSSDNGELDIGFVGGYLDTATLLTHCGAGDGFVTTWYDQIASENLVQATADSQPKIVSGGVYLSHIEFDGVNDKLSKTLSSSLATPNQFTSVAQTSAGSVFDFDPSLYSRIQWVTTNLRFYVGGGLQAYSYASTGIAIDNKKVCAIFIKSATDGAYYENNVLINGGASPTAVSYPVTFIILGSTYYNGAFGDLKISEFIISAPEADNTAIYLNQKAYWGLV